MYRIQALIDIPGTSVSAGDIGGYVQSYKNLSQEGSCWIYDDAKALGDARVLDDAAVRNYSTIKDNAVVMTNAVVYDRSCVGERAKIQGEAMVGGNASIRGHAMVSYKAEIKDSAVIEDAVISGHAKISGKACIFGNISITSSDDFVNFIFTNTQTTVTLSGIVVGFIAFKNYNEFLKKKKMFLESGAMTSTELRFFNNMIIESINLLKARKKQKA